MSRGKVTLGQGLRSAGFARAFVRGHLGAADVDVLETALLLTSELVTNAALHADPPIELAVECDEAGVTVCVGDHNTTVPRRRFAGLEAEGGRGLELLQALASSWGVRPAEPAEDGKWVWFTLAV